MQPLISIVAPFFNEEQAVDRFFQEVIVALEGIGAQWEIICVNDGS